MKTITYTPSCGEHVSITAQSATTLAKENGCCVKTWFNEVCLYATPKKSPKTIEWEYLVALGQKHEAFRLSKRGQYLERNAKEFLAKAQDSVSAAIKSLPGLIHANNLDHLMGWMHSFAHHSDIIGVDIDKAAGLKTGGYEWLAVLFESNGYKENHNVGNPPEWFCTKERMGQYIIGQAIACFRRGMPPHTVTFRFIEEYYKLPSA